MYKGEAMTKAFSPIILAALLVAGQLSGRSDQTTARPAASAHIESGNLRIEFDKNMRSRVIARFGGMADFEGRRYGAPFLLEDS
jgi:hypothetical protein